MFLKMWLAEMKYDDHLQQTFKNITGVERSMKIN